MFHFNGFTLSPREEGNARRKVMVGGKSSPKQRSSTPILLLLNARGDIIIFKHDSSHAHSLLRHARFLGRNPFLIRAILSSARRFNPKGGTNCTPEEVVPRRRRGKATRDDLSRFP